MTIDQIRQRIGAVEGWLTDLEGATLFQLAARCSGRGAIVEIGSWKGKSTIWLAHGSRSGNASRVYAVDPHGGHAAAAPDQGTFQEFERNLAEFQAQELVTPIVATSAEAAADFNHPIELLFIDGAHAYDLVKLDFELWAPKVINGGMIVLHDSNAGGIPILDHYLVRWPGPRRIAEERILKSRSFRNTRIIDTMTVGEKVAEASLPQVLRSRGILALRLPYNAVFRYSPQWIRAGARRIMPQL
jgi:predicted O-methyltransferase YrrM